MSRSHRRYRIREDARSLGISLAIHTVLLLILSWFVVSSVAQTTLSLTATTVVPDQSDMLVSMPALQHSAPNRSDAEPLIEIDPLRHGDVLASLSSDQLRPRFQPRLVEFFGAQAYGNRFVYILDRSISMSVREGTRFQRARDELIRSVSQLSSEQNYCVFLFCYRTTAMFGNTGTFSSNSRFARKGSSAFIAATPDNLRKLEYWLQDVFLDSGTDPRQAISRAYAMSPDAIFLLSDGSFNRSRATVAGEGWMGQFKIPSSASVYEGVELALSDIPIHTIAFENAFTRETMKGIAEVTGGSNRYVKTPSLEPKVPAVLINALIQIAASERTRAATLESQHRIRLSSARTLIEDGELAFAEYLLRPARDFHFTFQGHREQASEMFEILSSELGEVRVEDFESVSMAEIRRKVKQGRFLPRFKAGR